MNFEVIPNLDAADQLAYSNNRGEGVYVRDCRGREWIVRAFSFQTVDGMRCVYSFDAVGTKQLGPRLLNREAAVNFLSAKVAA